MNSINIIRLKNSWKLIASISFLSIAGLVLIRYLTTLNKYAINLPAWDDYDAVLNFLLEYLRAGTWSERLKLIFAQHNEHRIVTSRLLTLLQYYIAGEVNFRSQVLIGNCAFIVWLGCAYWLVRNKLNVTWQTASILLLPVLFILLQPQYGDGMLWTSTTIGCFWTASLAFLSLCLFADYFYLALLLMPVVVFTLGNGIVFPLCGIIYLFNLGKRKELIIWIMASVLVWVAYFYAYQKPHGHPSPFDALMHINRTISYFIAFLGSAVSFSNVLWAQIGGAIMLGWFLVVGLVFTIRPKDNYRVGAVFCFMLFLILTGLANSLSRSEFGVEYALQAGRYRFVSCMLLASCYITLLFYIKRAYYPMLLLVILPATFLYWRNSYAFYQEQLETFHGTLVADTFKWCVGQGGLTYPWHDRAADILGRSTWEGVYSFPESKLISSFIAVSNSNPKAVGSEFKFGIDDIWQDSTHYYLRGWALMDRMGKSRRKIFLRLTNDNGKDPSYMTTFSVARPDVATHFNNRRFLNTGFIAFIAKHQVEPGARLTLVLNTDSDTWVKTTTVRLNNMVPFLADQNGCFVGSS